MVKISSTQPIRGVFWFRNDLRTHDLPALSQLCEHIDELAFVYVMATEKEYRQPDDVSSSKLVLPSEKRIQFLNECIDDLRTNLRKLGHDLTLLKGDQITQLSAFCEQHKVSYIGVTEHAGVNERVQVQALDEVLAHTQIILGEGASMIDEEQLPFSIPGMPSTFSPFRRKIEKRLERTDDVLAPSISVTQLPPPFVRGLSPDTVTNIPVAKQFVGGESAVLRHLDNYFKLSHQASVYKETRNALDTWEHSTKFSPWLAHGCISPKTILKALIEYEGAIEKNENTYWIYFELLWRDFFLHLQKRHTKSWFAFDGINGTVPSSDFRQSEFQRWCDGNTGYDIVDACMKQLSTTGYMSNRGRQLVASCFVHELNLDWRYGASWFEHTLLDYDVASNWGNWQYLAGVGCDPRGHRQFNLEKQTQMYDPNGEFRNRWLT